jgi:enoyl-CoA hydratase/carnithine racemase
MLSDRSLLESEEVDPMDKEYKRLKCIRKGKGGELLWLVFDHVEKHNALGDEMQLELIGLFEKIVFDNEIRCVVLTGSGEKAFSAGGDIKYFQSLNPVTFHDYLYHRGAHIQRLMNCMEKPIVAAVNGLCLAGGMELALSCDMIYASENARFGLTEINIGGVPGWGGTARLPLKIPVNRAKEMIFRGEIISAQEAYRLGLVNRVLPTIEALYEEVETACLEMLAKPPLALKAAKNVINNAVTCDSIEAALAIERGTCVYLFGTEDNKEAVAAFAEKRKPTFIGR